MADGTDAPSLWTLAVAGLIAPLGFFLKQSFDRISKIETMLAQTRETLARDYMPKDDMKVEMERVIARFDRLEIKLDKFIERTVKQ